MEDATGCAVVVQFRAVCLPQSLHPRIDLRSSQYADDGRSEVTPEGRPKMGGHGGRQCAGLMHTHAGERSPDRDRGAIKLIVRATVLCGRDLVLDRCCLIGGFAWIALLHSVSLAAWARFSSAGRRAVMIHAAAQ